MFYRGIPKFKYQFAVWLLTIALAAYLVAKSQPLTVGLNSINEVESLIVERNK